MRHPANAGQSWTPMATPSHWFVSEIRLKGFKSFSDSTVVHVPCHQLVGVVGPNGTGKSNLLEGLLFASGAAASDLRVRTLKDLCNTDLKDQLCEGEFKLTKHIPGWSVHLANKAPTHTVRAALTPDGSRVFQLDGRNRSAQQIKEFLRGVGVHLDSSTSVIRQAQVTRLADTNTPQAVLEVVAAASGLARWNQETQRAQTELKDARAALKSIQDNVAQLNNLIRADSAVMQQVELAGQLEQQALGTAQALVAAYTIQHQAESAGVMATQDTVNQLHDGITVLQGELREMEEAAAAAARHSHPPPAGGGVRGKSDDRSRVLQLIRQLASLEEQVRAASQHAQQAVSCQQQYEQYSTQLASLQLQSDSTCQLLQCAHINLSALEAALDDEEAEAGGDLGVYLSHISSLLTKSHHTVKQLEQQCRQAEQSSQAAQLQLDSHLQQVNMFEAQLVKLQQQAGSAHPAPGQQDAQHQVRLLQDHLSSALVQVRVLVNQLALPPEYAKVLQTRGLYWAQGSSSVVQQQQQQWPARLHSLFEWKLATGEDEGNDQQPTDTVRPQAAVRGSKTAEAVARGGDEAESGSVGIGRADVTRAQGWCRALSVIAGGSLDVVVVATSAQAGQALQDPDATLARCGGAACAGRAAGGTKPAAGSTLRIWPLDRITYNDHTAAQRAAQAALPPAMVRAFGRFVLARDSDTSAVLAQRFGIASVTPDGTVSKLGSVSGGYLGPAGRKGAGRPATGPEAVLAAKLDLQLALERHHHLAAQLAASEQVLQEQARAAACRAQHEAATEQLQVLRSRTGQLQSKVEVAAAALAAVTDQLSAARQGADRYAALLSSTEQQHTNQSKSAPCNGALHQARQQEVQAAKANVQGLQSKVHQLQGQVHSVKQQMRLLVSQHQELQLLTSMQDEGAEQDVAGGEEEQYHEAEEVGGELDWDVAALQARHVELVQASEVVRHQLEAARHQEAQHVREAQAAQDAAAAAAVRCAELQQEINRMRSQQQEAEGQLKAQQQRVVQYKKHVEQLCKQYKIQGQLDLGHAPKGGGAGGTPDVKHLSDQLTRLKTQREAVGQVQGLSSTEMMASRSRVQDVHVFQSHAQDLSQAVDVLEQGMTASEQQVLSAHNLVFAGIRGRFQQLCAILLPSLTLDLAPASAKQSVKSPNEAVDLGKGSAQGAVIVFKRQPASRAAPAGGQAWLNTLEQLSGGQRTLVSLALLLASALEGARSSVLLLDEVDAALDEANQSLVAGLLWQLAHGTLGQGQAGDSGAGQPSGRSAAGGAQVLCVSHHVAFQKACDALIQVSRLPAGTHAAAATTRAGGMASNVDTLEQASPVVQAPSTGAKTDGGQLSARPQALAAQSRKRQLRAR